MLVGGFGSREEGMGVASAIFRHLSVTRHTSDFEASLDLGDCQTLKAASLRLFEVGLGCGNGQILNRRGITSRMDNGGWAGGGPPKWKTSECIC